MLSFHVRTYCLRTKNEEKREKLFDAIRGFCSCQKETVFRQASPADEDLSTQIVESSKQFVEDMKAGSAQFVQDVKAEVTTLSNDLSNFTLESYDGEDSE